MRHKSGRMVRNCLSWKLLLISSSCHSAMHSEFPTYVFSRLHVASGCLLLLLLICSTTIWYFLMLSLLQNLNKFLIFCVCITIFFYPKADPLNNVISCISPFILLTNHCLLPVQPFQLHAANQAFLWPIQDELLGIRNLARKWPSSLI